MREIEPRRRRVVILTALRDLRRGFTSVYRPVATRFSGRHLRLDRRLDGHRELLHATRNDVVVVLGPGVLDLSVDWFRQQRCFGGTLVRRSVNPRLLEPSFGVEQRRPEGGVRVRAHHDLIFEDSPLFRLAVAVRLQSASGKDANANALRP